MSVLASSPAGFSEAELPSSPHNVEKSFMTNVAATFTEDEDNTRTNRVVDTPTLSERHGRGSGGRGRGGKDSAAGSANGANGTGGNGLFKDPSAIGKIRHLKKEDGEPLWRRDIQYDFLRAVFDDERKVFTNSYEPDTIGKQCFADLYIDTMARSSKTSKVLHDKLLSDRRAAKSMAMVCLLVNIGRMNTTLNFFPEMRAQLRTYHAIPSLQVHQDAHDYKQLQDAPRLKSILKGGLEDRPEPRTLEKLKDKGVPRTNPVNLIFLICNNAAKIAELHFPLGREFHDLIMKTNLSSRSRAAAFLWIMWFYLESDFTEEGCEENPFGPGVDYGVDVANQGVPVLVDLTQEEEDDENRDTAEECEFGLAKKTLRSNILRDEHSIHEPAAKRSSRASTRPSTTAINSSKENGPPAADGDRFGSAAILPRIRPSKHESDADSSRSTPPPPRSSSRMFAASANAGTSSKRMGPLKYQIIDGSSPVRQPPLIQQLHQQQQLQQVKKKRKQPKQQQEQQYNGEDDDADAGTSIPTVPSRKPRPPTAHQIAVEKNRKQRIEYLLSRGMQRKHHRARKLRRMEGSITRALRRVEKMDNPFDDSESEDNVSWNRRLFSPQPGAPQNMSTGDSFRERGFGGLVLLAVEPDDFGEEVFAYGSALRRACRRLNRWESLGNAAVAPVKRLRVNGESNTGYRDPNETEEEPDLDMELDLSTVELPPPPKRRRIAGTPATIRAKTTKVAKEGAGGNRRRRTATEQHTNGAGIKGEDSDDAPMATISGAEAAAEEQDDVDAEGEGYLDEGHEPISGGRGLKCHRSGQRKGEDYSAAEEDELNDMDKTLLGMGEVESESD